MPVLVHLALSTTREPQRLYSADLANIETRQLEGTMGFQEDTEMLVSH